MGRFPAGRLGLAAAALVLALPACAGSPADTSNPTGGQFTILASGPARIDSRKAPRNVTAPASSANQRHPANEAVSAIAPSDDPGPSTSLPVLRIWYGAPEEPPDPFISALAAHADPDPNVRVHALETWARDPGESLDPATYALVDPDESVRARAQELLEEALDRR